MEVEAQPPMPLPPRRWSRPAVAISKVLDDGDLLDEILLRVGFPTTLVRAALVYRRCLRHASDPAFLRRFRTRHAPRVLGLYVTTAEVHGGHFVPETRPRFVPVPPPPELAAVARGASFDLDPSNSYSGIYVAACGNDRVVMAVHSPYVLAVRSPLYPARETVILPSIPRPDGGDDGGFGYFLPNDDGGDGLSPYLMLSMRAMSGDEPQTLADVYALQDDGASWAIRALAATEMQLGPDPEDVVLVGSKIYMVNTVNSVRMLVLLDLVSSSFSVVKLPDRVELERSGQNLLLSRANDASGLYLIHLINDGLQLRVWLHRTNTDTAVGNDWLIVESISLRDVRIRGCRHHWQLRMGVDSQI